LDILPYPLCSFKSLSESLDMAKEISMSKRAPTIEWHMAESEADWMRLCAPPLPDSPQRVAPAAHKHSLPKQFLRRVVILSLVLVGVGGWGWRTVQTESQQGKRERAPVAHRSDPVAASLTNFAPQPAPSIAIPHPG
jgi:hypothetical protein